MIVATLTSCLALTCIVASPEQPVTSSGTLVGRVVQTSHGEVRQLLGVRYCEAPVRFSPPVPHQVQDNTKIVEVTKHGAACQQPPHLTELMYPQLTLHENDKSVNEDCLFLNVFLPVTPAPANQPIRAIMVWIPGEGFGFADAAQFDGSYLAVRGDVIVITVNYRVGVFGFLSTGNSSVPGNHGLWDVLEALRWVRRNAAALGGDPARVTLFGRFTGAMIASLLLTSPYINQRDATGRPSPLVARVILQSGVGFGNYVLDEEPANRTDTLAHLAGCEGTHQQVMACLRAVPSGRLDQLSWQVPQLWRPVVDGTIITTDPLRAIRRAAYDRGVQIMIGETGGEGSICLLQHYYLETVFSRAILADNVTKREFVQLVQEHVYDYLKVQDPSVIEAAVHEYRPWPDSNASFRDQFLHFCGALYTRVKSEQLARWLARRGTTVWRYEFSYRPQCSPHPRFMGPAHGDEVLFVFGLLEEEATGQETQLEQRVLTSWTNFAKTGDPNMNSTLVWKQFTDGAKHMMVFSVPQNSMKMTDFLSRDLDFWNLMVPGLLRHTQRALLHGRATGREHGSQPSTCPSGTSVGLLIMSLVLSTALLLISYYLCHSVRNSNKGLLTQDHTAQH